MRVLVVSSFDPRETSNGGSLILHHHLRALAPEHDLRVLVAAGRPTVPTPAPVPLEIVRPRLPGALDYAVRRARSELTGEPAHVLWVERPTLVAALRRDLAERRPDVVHLHGWGTAQLWRHARAVPVVHMAIDAWGLGAGGRRLPSWRRFTDAGQGRKIAAHERRHYPRCARVVVVAPRDAAYIEREAPAARVAVVPNGVELGPEPLAPADDTVIGFHGVLSTTVNRDAALMVARDILPRVRREVSGARAIVIGRAPPPEILRLASADVTITGEVADVRAELARAAVYVAPMVGGTGLKNKVLEAMAAGLPVVGTPLALEGIGPGPGVRIAATADDIAVEVVALLKDPAARVAEGRAARARVAADFTWQRSARAIGALWREVVSTAAPRP